MPSIFIMWISLASQLLSVACLLFVWGYLCLSFSRSVTVSLKSKASYPWGTFFSSSIWEAEIEIERAPALLGYTRMTLLTSRSQGLNPSLPCGWQWAMTCPLSPARCELAGSWNQRLSQDLHPGTVLQEVGNINLYSKHTTPPTPHTRGSFNGWF